MMRVRRDHLFLILLTALFIAAAPPAIADQTREAAHHRIVERVFKHVNQQRAMNGAGALTLNARLTDAAQKHAADMSRRDFVGHRSPDGRALQDRIASAGYPWRAIAENLAAGQSSPETTVQSWMTSSGHRDNMLSRDYLEAGIGYAVPSGEGKRPRYSHYWVVVFGARSR
ncbi:MAG: CAP domain-containing protein [Alphaproteobacteria bacterium]|jgi:uncharacterized protein YkwD|nr:CAP domain-containing protein [Alphaproteobacteria bacterium]